MLQFQFNGTEATQKYVFDRGPTRAQSASAGVHGRTLKAVTEVCGRSHGAISQDQEEFAEITGRVRQREVINGFARRVSAKRRFRLSLNRSGSQPGRASTGSIPSVCATTRHAAGTDGPRAATTRMKLKDAGAGGATGDCPVALSSLVPYWLNLFRIANRPQSSPCNIQDFFVEQRLPIVLKD